MFRRIFLLLLVWPAFFQGRTLVAVQVPMEKMLPADTLAAVCVPDGARLKTFLADLPLRRLWDDPAMRPFRVRFMKGFSEDVLSPLEKASGIRLAEDAMLAQGQCVLAFTRNGWPQGTNSRPGIILMLDAGENAGVLEARLAVLRRQWAGSGGALKTNVIRGAAFTSLFVRSKQWEKCLQTAVPPLSDGPFASEISKKTNAAASSGIEIVFGQTGSLLLAANSAALIESVLAGLAGEPVPTLADVPGFKADAGALFREARLYAWADVKGLLEAARVNPAAERETSLLDRWLSAAGADGLTHAAAAVEDTGAGVLIKMFVGTPEAARSGLAAVWESGITGTEPPPFVPADAVKFSRWRFDLRKAFGLLEAMAAEVVPEYAGASKLVFDAAGKDGNPGYDLRRELTDSLGGDLMIWSQLPEETNGTAQPLPSLFLIGTPQSEKLAAAVKIGLATLAPPDIPQAGLFGERGFEGRKIYSLNVPPGPESDAAPAGALRGLHFAAGDGYLAVSKNAAMIEHFLRGETNRPGLAAMPGLAEMARSVGGWNTGWFAWENRRETMRRSWENARREAAAKPDGNNAGERVDFSLLPPFEQISRYFHMTAAGGRADTNGFLFRFFYPAPPGPEKH